MKSSKVLLSGSPIRRLVPAVTKAVTMALLALPLSGALYAQAPATGQSSHATHAATPADESKSLLDQIAELRAEVAKLQAALQQKRQSKSSGMNMGNSKGMGMMGPMMSGAEHGMGMGQTPSGSGSGSMSGMGQMKAESKPMAGGSGGASMPGMGGMMGEMGGMGSMSSGSDTMPGIGMMGRMSGPHPMPTQSALPGFPGASHIYHVGSTGFFLDHAQHINLTVEQQAALNRIKEKALLEQATAQRKIDEAEQELWTQTASDQPDSAQIQAKVREVEKLRADQRVSFIRAVGEAAKALTDQQRQVLRGQAAAMVGK